MTLAERTRNWRRSPHALVFLAIGWGVAMAPAASAAPAAPAKRVRTIRQARAYVAQHAPGTAPLYLTARSTEAVLHGVIDVEFDSEPGWDFASTVFYRPLVRGSSTGQVLVNGFPDGNPSALMSACRARGHRVSHRRIGRFATLYCADDITFYYVWRWKRHRYVVGSKYYGGVTTSGLRKLIAAMVPVR